MSKKTMMIKPVSAAVGVAFVASAAVSSIAVADQDNPFQMSDLDSGYMLAGGHKGDEGKCGEGKCGDDKGDEGKCGEGKCGDDKGDEGKCGEGKCGG